MVQTAAQRFSASPLRQELDGADRASTSAAAFDNLRGRLRAAQDRAAVAERRRLQVFADARQALDGRASDVHRLEQAIAALERRAFEYSRALNEAASLVEDMDCRIALFEARFSAIRHLLDPHGPPVSIAFAEAALTEDLVARDLDQMRGRGARDDEADLRTRLSLILAA